MLDRSGNPVNPEDLEAVANWHLQKNGVEFGKASDIYTEEQLDRLTRRRKDMSIDDVLGELPDINFRSSQELLDRARDQLDAGLVVGISPQQSQILKLLIDGLTVREIGKALDYSVSYTHELIQCARAAIEKEGSDVWIWLTIAEQFRMSAAAVRANLSK